MKLGWVVGGVMAVGALGLLVCPCVCGGNFATPKKGCLSNLKQLSQSLLVYAAANDDLAPFQEWMTCLVPGTTGENVGSCPLVVKDDKQYGYAMNAEIIGSKLSTLDPTTVAMFDTDALGASVIANLAARANRHGLGGNVGRVDGSAKFVRDNQNNMAKP